MIHAPIEESYAGNHRLYHRQNKHPLTIYWYYNRPFAVKYHGTLPTKSTRHNSVTQHIQSSDTDATKLPHRVTAVAVCRPTASVKHIAAGAAMVCSADRHNITGAIDFLFCWPHGCGWASTTARVTVSLCQLSSARQTSIFPRKCRMLTLVVAS